MSRYLLQRAAQALVVLFVVSTITFVMVSLAPGGPAIMTTMETTPEMREAHRRRLGLDQPLPVRFVKWTAAAVRADFGRSFNDGRRVGEVIRERLPNTLLLGGAALLLSVLIGIPAGIVSATRRASPVDYTVTFLSFIGVSIPAFWFAILLILLFSVRLDWLPASGMATIGAPFSLADRLLHLIMPAFVLATATMPGLVRFMRSALLEELGQDYVRTARAKGLAGRRVLTRHAIRNALIPVVTILGVLIPRLVGGAVITETIFGWPGMGQLAVASTVGRDYPLVMGLTVVVAIVVVFSNLVVDLAYGWLDPRITYG
ncbi:MAG: ABC transporter permease [Armatimonadota bacterium]|nr:ABC transporter permease [Armatimonadota bacterium]